MKINWKSIALVSWLIVPMLAAHTLSTTAHRADALAQLRAMKKMQTTAHHNTRTQVTAMDSQVNSAGATATECKPTRAAIKLAEYNQQLPAQLALNIAAHETGSWAAAPYTLLTPTRSN